MGRSSQVVCIRGGGGEEKLSQQVRMSHADIKNTAG